MLLLLGVTEGMIAQRFTNGVLFLEHYYSGEYGSTKCWDLAVVFENKTLELQRVYSERYVGALQERWQTKYQDCSLERLIDLVKHAPQYAPLCDQCEKPTYESDSIVYQGDLRRCATCHAEIPYDKVSPEVLERSKKRRDAQREGSHDRQTG